MRGLKRRPEARDRPGAAGARMHRYIATGTFAACQRLPARVRIGRMHDFRQEGSAAGSA
ncbi:hypothetical protein M3O57_01545 [Xanthomonas nasturtii]|uniref:Uncharacterized protein n=1 Tax=Xanthomonas nasturtii TaxID=1843581 RepID=A0ABT0LKC7_9XANT|nr:hypothetical protein [Xanthomonas nasturtii]MCL1497826.1 hypothetical protein [Xanthomonas nasturtii]MCL1502284.1 hypothetical protein [Xanthomonas nasturtii]MCL1522048.1 hypothetical protein [Xanthomonas nasturtii]MCL1529148.1 hypothetical protein [Xanthomonas nasturtii]MCL1549793.1 hypothetical protein [Xanthomonas nasturtii]